jgi:hypothetical protein
MDILAWFWWLFSNTLGLAWALVWFLISGCPDRLGPVASIVPQFISGRSPERYPAPEIGDQVAPCLRVNFAHPHRCAKHHLQQAGPEIRLGSLHPVLRSEQKERTNLCW